jgi:hypothetical protein
MFILRALRGAKAPLFHVTIGTHEFFPQSLKRVPFRVWWYLSVLVPIPVIPMKALECIGGGFALSSSYGFF